MPKVDPALVLSVLDVLIPQASTGGQIDRLAENDAPAVAAIVRLAREIPPELMPPNPKDYGEFVQGLEALSFAVTRWEAAGNTDVPQAVAGSHMVRVFRNALLSCPNQRPAVGTADLQFLASDPDLRDGIRLDISAAESSLRIGEWKGATVLAGSVVEALLLWAVAGRTEADRKAAIAALPATAVKPKDTKLEKWGLAELVSVSSALGIIKDNTRKQAELATHFRNFIHPGKALRLAAKCDYGTALAAVAAIQFVVRDLS